MDFAEIKNKSIAELKELLADKREELRLLKFKSHNRALKQNHQIGDLKRVIARVNTLLNSRVDAE